jgi:hypothetical protein
MHRYAVTKKHSSSKAWLIEGRDGLEVIWHSEVPLSQYSEPQMEELLRLLVARAELSFDEICASTGRKRKYRAALLDVRRQIKPFSLMCGSGKWFTARVVIRH